MPTSSINMNTANRPYAAAPWRAAAAGFILGVLLWLGARELGLRAIPGGANSYLPLLSGLVGSLLALSRARGLLWIAGAAECLGLLVISYTPLAPALMRSWVRSDPLQPSDAVVSLSSKVYPDGTLDELNTHDEALAVARLVRRRGWRRVILVSDPVHLRRAGAVFAHAGVRVCCSPGASTGYNVRGLETPGDRLTAFRDWLREWLGWQIYRWRGWI